MRNYFAIAFTCVYLILTVGVAKTTHYCMGRLSHSSLYSFESNKCPCYEPQQGPVSCCKDVHQLVALGGDQDQTEVTDTQSPDYFQIGVLFHVLFDIKPATWKAVLKLHPEDSAPPPRQALYKLHCSYVFYG